MYTNFGAVIRITTDANSYINLSLLGAKMIYSPQYILGAEKYTTSEVVWVNSFRIREKTE